MYEEILDRTVRSKFRRRLSEENGRVLGYLPSVFNGLMFFQVLSIVYLLLNTKSIDVIARMTIAISTPL